MVRPLRKPYGCSRLKPRWFSTRSTPANVANQLLRKRLLARIVHEDRPSQSADP